MKPRDDEGHEGSRWKNDNRPNIEKDKGLKNSLYQEEFRSKFVMIG
jgi:hypothetical protein